MQKEVIKLPRNTVMATDNVLFTVKQQNAINQRTPKKYIHKRAGRGGQQWDYVTSAYVKRQLNRIFGYAWSFEIKTSLPEAFEIALKTKQCVVMGRLEIYTQSGVTLVREQVGRADVKMRQNGAGLLDFGNDMKAAATDAFKKCASEIGIAADIYAANEYHEYEIEDVEDIQLKEINENIDKAINELEKEAEL